MQELQNLIQGNLQQKLDDGTLEKLVDKQVTDLLNDAVKDSLRSWSPFGKGLKEMLEQKLQLDPTAYSFTTYNHMVQGVVQRLLDAHLQQHLKTQVEEGVAEILKPFDISKPIKVSDLVRDFMEQSMDYEDNMQGRITCHIEHSTYPCEGNWQFYLDEKPNTERYSCDIQGMVSKEGELFSLKISDKRVENTLFIGPFYKFERKLFNLYANKAKLECDEDSVETSWDKY